jgi:hypothetical protein
MDHLLVSLCFFFDKFFLSPYVDVFFSQFGLSWVMPRQVVDLYACRWTVGSAQNAVVEDSASIPFVVSMDGKE